LGVGLAPERLAALSERGVVRIISAAALRNATAPPIDETEVVLVVTDGAVDGIRGVRIALPLSPILALVDHVGNAPHAIEAGADYVLPANAESPMIDAVYSAARRAVTNRVRRPISDYRTRMEQELERSCQRLAETQTQLMHSGRLAALGQMAAGVAHEINNPLQYVLAGIEELSELPTLDAEKRQTLSDMLEGAQRIRSVTQALLPFARVDGSMMEMVDFNEVVEWAARVTANEIRHRARLELRLAPVPRVFGKRVRLGQLVTNFLTNAAHAITEGASELHRVTVTTDAFDDCVRLTVTDTGSGIPEEVPSRVFDPFFTTKPREIGTGLGLTLCAEMFARQGGTIDFDSTVGEGTTFVITVPKGPADTRTAPPVSGAQPQSRAPRALLIDDEALILQTYKRFLKGLDVVTAAGGKAAISILAHDTDFDVIICDVMMPSVDGPMVYAYIRENVPQLASRILFCTGGAFTARVREFLEQIPNIVLDKPVRPQLLRSAIDDLLARNGSVAAY
jgi:signal transduction histidine kinase